MQVIGLPSRVVMYYRISNEKFVQRRWQLIALRAINKLSHIKAYEVREFEQIKGLEQKIGMIIVT